MTDDPDVLSPLCYPYPMALITPPPTFPSPSTSPSPSPSLVSIRQISLEWTDIQSVIYRQSSLPKTKMSVVRSPGLHLSGLIKVEMVKRNLLKQEDLQDTMPICVGMGIAWENWVVGLWPEMTWQPGEVKRREVTGSPDGRSYLLLCCKCGVQATTDQTREGIECPCGGEFDLVPVIEEFKCTWKSKHGRSILTESAWIWQAGAYLLMDPIQKGRKWRYARFHIFWVNGDYRPPSPQYWTYLVRFNESWLERMWDMVVEGNRGEAVPE